MARGAPGEGWIYDWIGLDLPHGSRTSKETGEAFGGQENWKADNLRLNDAKYEPINKIA